MDPEYHIRLRIHFNDISHIGFIISCLMKELGEYVNNNVISNIVVDTYKREIERYRERYIQDVERLFYIDSKYIINFLSNEENEVDKWLVSVKYIDLLLDMCDFKLNDKIDFCTRIKSAFAEEIYSNDKYIRKQLNQNIVITLSCFEVYYLMIHVISIHGRDYCKMNCDMLIILYKKLRKMIILKK